MRTIYIKHFRTRHTLYEGRFKNIRQAVEAAIREGVSLAFADLRHANLVNAEMDGALLDGAQLCDANLLGANLSEATLRRTNFQNALLHSTTLCESIIDNALFNGALCGATDIAGAKISRCQFDTLSALDLNFAEAALLDHNSFIAAQDIMCAFSRPPMVLKGLGKIVACFDHKIMVGHEAFHLETPPQHGSTADFIQTHHALLQNLWSAHHGTPVALRVA